MIFLSLLNSIYNLNSLFKYIFKTSDSNLRIIIFFNNTKINNFLFEILISGISFSDMLDSRSRSRSRSRSTPVQWAGWTAQKSLNSFKQTSESLCGSNPDLRLNSLLWSRNRCCPCVCAHLWSRVQVQVQVQVQVRVQVLVVSGAPAAACLGPSWSRLETAGRRGRPGARGSAGGPAASGSSVCLSAETRYVPPEPPSKCRPGTGAER